MESRTVWRAIHKQLRSNRWVALAFLILLLEVTMAVLAPWIATHDPIRQDFRRILEPPSREHWLGTDELGRDIFSRIVYGARISFTVGVAAVALGAAIGVVIGLFAGYYGGTFDSVAMRCVDVLLAFPGILLAILIAAALGSGLFPVILAVATYSVPTFARLTRGSALAVSRREYVEAARAAGARDARILLRHVLANSFGPILVYATLLMGSAILTAASLSFLGVGVAPPTPEWGAMISTGRNYMRQAPHVVVAPGMAIFVTVLAFNVLGDALRDALDPRT